MTRPALALVRNAPSALARRGGLHYVRGAIASPVCVASTVFATCVGLSCAGTLGALLAVAMVVGACVALSRFAVVQRHLDTQGEYLEMAKREATRLRMIRPAGPVRVQQYCELRNLVEGIERTDPVEASRFELQDLLEHFTRLVVAHHKCLVSLRFAQDADFSASLPIAEANRTKRRREILARRIAHRDACLKRVERLADELEAVDELVRLCAQRVACPAMDPELDRELDRRLWELDEQEAAMAQLAG